MSVLNVRKFNVNDLPLLGVIVFVGRSGSGKTVAMTDILYHMRHKYDRVLVMTGSTDTAQHFGKHVPPILVHEGFDEDRIERIYQQQERARSMGKCKPILIILDDLMYQNNILQKSEVMNRIFMNGRHALISLFISMQYCKSLGPQLRMQANFIFCARENNPENRVRIYESFNTIFSSKQEFEAVFQSCTKHREMLVLANVFNESDDVSDNVFWYKAKIRKHFRVCKKSPAWILNKELYDAKYMLRPPNPMRTIGKGRGRGRGMTVNLKR